MNPLPPPGAPRRIHGQVTYPADSCLTRAARGKVTVTEWHRTRSRLAQSSPSTSRTPHPPGHPDPWAGSNGTPDSGCCSSTASLCRICTLSRDTGTAAAVRGGSEVSSGAEGELGSSPACRELGDPGNRGHSGLSCHLALPEWGKVDFLRA